MNQPSFILPATHFDLKKRKQIETLKALMKEEICEVRPDTYHIPLKISNNQFVLKVHLPGEFPKSQPLIWIYPVPCHNWITEEGRILSPGLVNYSQNSELGCLVHEIIREMRKSITISNYPLTKCPEATENPTSEPYYMPPFLISELEYLSNEKLKTLNENEDMLEDFAAELPQAVEVFKDLDSKHQQLESLAVSVGNLKKNVNTQRQKLIEHYEVLNLMKEQWDSMMRKHQDLAQRYLPNSIEASLHSAAALVDEQSEEIAEKFLSGQINIDTFLNTYLSSRSLNHVRKAKEEIFGKQLQELQRSGYF